MDVWSRATLRSLFWPGGLLLAAAATLLQTRLVTPSPSAVNLFYSVAFAAGLLLAWRFHSSRVFFALLVLLLAERAVEFFSAGRMPAAGPGRLAFEAVCFLLPLNFILLALARERGFSLATVVPRALVLFVESVAVAVLCRPGQVAGHSPALPRGTIPPIPQTTQAAFVVAVLVLLARFLIFRKPVESAFLWALSATFLALRRGAVGLLSTAYLAISAVILAVSIVETSYFMAYHDELTGLPGRRAFNGAILRLEAPYAVAIVDIDHFKRFNDTYGHDVGDEVLRMVASQLARVSGGGQAYRCGGEEFAVLFPGKSSRETMDHLESLRAAIAVSTFRIRGADRRRVPRGPERRSQRGRGRAQAGRTIRELAYGSRALDLSVTVSIGVADPSTTNRDLDRVIQAADKALYRAKAAGRNRVESAASPRGKTKAARSIA